LIYVKQNNRKPAAPAILKRGTVVVDLTSATSVAFKMRRTTGIDLVVDAAAVVTDATNGVIEYRWAAGDTDRAGEHYAEWEVLWSDGTTETFPTIGYDIVFIDADLDRS